ncbi:alkylation response protein AidB-like acyl-CoA dehydrogenase [Antricoccus suffuscus]|uniref:Alkylation response protein AidB-like acyl-CoA dehydrogenase n=1 Tax=Antricoccus suffuscus TaxID=1629062 RepID=A0A2T1A6F4_9ACTN|nr:acyl-CoA dehydrogenase family protein [Antricoccus suffuscus]PRZ44057.1 alkylation response protein AidB-like acyl-CoA dehydrogenase [Antricoccus suffuscus]
MKFVFSEEQEELRQEVRRFLQKTSPLTEVRRLMETDEGYDPAIYRQMAQQLGLQSLAIPEEYGGAGYGWLELVVVFEEMGRGLLCAPYFSSIVLAASALLESGDDAAKRDLLPGIAAGTTRATLAHAEDNGQWDGSQIVLTAVQSDGDWQLTGHKSFVVDGATADVVLVIGRTAAGLALFAVSEGFSRTPLATMDQTRRLARLEFAATPARLIGTDGDGERILNGVRDLAAVALACEQVGGAQACLDMSVDYAKMRHQFGRPIGSFQAIKHLCADMLLEIESARSAAYAAGWAIADQDDDLPAIASLAKAYCSDAYFNAARNTIQIHGGLGFTWEHDAHLYFKRAKSSEFFFGDSSYHREQYLQRSGI